VWDNHAKGVFAFGRLEQGNKNRASVPIYQFGFDEGRIVMTNEYFGASDRMMVRIVRLCPTSAAIFRRQANSFYNGLLDAPVLFGRQLAWTAVVSPKSHRASSYGRNFSPAWDRGTFIPLTIGLQ